MSTPAGGTDAAPLLNVMTVDVEDYFHVSAFEGVVSRDAWSTYESRVTRNTERMLSLFADADVRGTFFVLGWVADRYPALVRRIAEQGHELASHSYWHRLVYSLSPAEFREDLRRARTAIEQAAGVCVRGFRAPSYSITERSLWALDVLADEGYDYDASIFPIRHDRYGIPSAPRHPHRVGRDRRVLEIPGTVAGRGPVTIPVGGGYFRLFPYGVTRWAIDSANAAGRAAVFYIHPWEIDPDQPRMTASLVSRLRHYNNLHKAEARLTRLLREFRFGPIASAIQEVSEPSAAGQGATA